MKKTIVMLMTCICFVAIASAPLAADFIISYPFAYKERFPDGAERLGLPEGDVLQVGCFIKPVGTPIKEVSIKNLSSGLVLKAIPMKYDSQFPGLYEVYPLPPFDPSKHMGAWEVTVKDKSGNEITGKTPEMDLKGKFKSEDLSKVYVRLQCLGLDKNDDEYLFPVEFQSSTILPLKEILENQ